MKLVIESSQEIVLHQGAACRAWLGKHENGREVVVLVAGVLLADDDPRDAEFERELLGPFVAEPMTEAQAAAFAEELARQKVERRG